MVVQPQQQPQEIQQPQQQQVATAQPQQQQLVVQPQQQQPIRIAANIKVLSKYFFFLFLEVDMLSQEHITGLCM
jgi:hypothetical protein